MVLNYLQRLIVLLLFSWPFTIAAQSYSWRAVAMGGGGFVDGIVFHPTAKDVMYVRTDVGGAYRWDDQKQEWIPLTDWLGPTQWNFTGIESIALDPSNSNRVYLAAGTYSSGPAAILCSVNQGQTFQIVQTPFHMGGNEDGRQNGERLAVDPNDGAILFFGSRRDGLWKSVDYGTTWACVNSFTNIGSSHSALVFSHRSVHRERAGGWFGDQPVGINSVVFDAASGRRGLPTPVIYAVVSTPGTNFFRSIDAGSSWQPVRNQPIGLLPSHLILSADGLLYLTCGSAAGPNNVNNGAVWKFNPKNDAWTDISPEKKSGRPINWGYGAVSVDAQHPSTIMVTTIDRWKLHDEVFRSTDGGTTWRGILLNGRMNYSMAPYTRRMIPHWTGTLAINPNNPDQVLFGTGYGIWCCTNATRTDSGGRADWVFLDKGLEETVPLALISPPVGAHLISGVGDIDGFRHEDVDISPPEGTFPTPRFSNTQGLAFAASKPEFVVRIGNGGKATGVHAAISKDGGKNWQVLRNDPPGGSSGQGKIAISADTSAIVWVVQPNSAFVTFDRGASWKSCVGFSGNSISADPVNPSRFYALDTRNGKLLASTNRAESFEATTASLPSMDFGLSGVLAVASGMEGDIWVGFRNDGLFHSIDGGASFTKIGSVDGADALGFGKAAPGRNYPALYLLGDANRRYARYRSDDAGQTWIRIDDEQHQYARANVPIIIGDPRIYGRVYFTTGGRGVICGDINSSPIFGKE